MRHAVWAMVSAAVLVSVPAVRGQSRLDLEWARIPAGTFEMGCVPDDADCLESEQPRHPVTISRPFDLMITEVTVAQYLMFARASGWGLPPRPDFLQTGRHPIALVDWSDAHAFCEWVGGRLPTEAEWERAARGGHEGRIYWWGGQMSDGWANYGIGNGGAVSGDDQWVNTAPVGSFPPNDFGLYDMTGNVWEWVADWYDEYPTRAVVDPLPAAGVLRVARGGSWFNPPPVLRLSVRLMFHPTAKTSNVGIRCARDVPSLVAN